MAYGTEAIIPIEHQVPTIQSLAWNQEQNDHMLKFNLNLLEEKRNGAAVRLTSYQQTLMNSHNRKVRHKGFAPGDLVLKRKIGIIKKIVSPWKGPYRVAEVIGKGAYVLETMAGRLRFRSDVVKKYPFIHIKLKDYKEIHKMSTIKFYLSPCSLVHPQQPPQDG
ncbi:uncharacterized protein LOC132269772 [Cornus florida]|uniref:uncharacterized protein LOC132269772 n=1 Tax=Cornus florida TaxID=4283 RepID=UPI00289DA45B|nr:uncharacterized protein LOC132269772 [Cornus florida]